MDLKIYKAKRGLSMPLCPAEVAAGFPSPAEGDMDSGLDLNDLIIKHPAATFFVKVSGNSMIDAHIYPGDILVVDRAQQPSNRDIVVAIIDGEFTVKRLLKKGDTIILSPENSQFPSIEVSRDHDFQVWGKVTYVIHKAK